MIELAVDGVEAAGLREQWVRQNFWVPHGLRPQSPADADEPLSLLGRPIPASDYPLHAVFDACLIGHERVADRSLANEADDMGGNIRVSRPAIGLPEAGF
jgi:hypothetical protein